MWIAAILAIIGAAASAVATKYSADAQKKAAQYNADVARKNAVAAAQQGQFDAEQIRDKNKRVLAAQRAAAASSGVDFSGSAMDVQTDSAAQGEMDALVAIYTGRSSANSQEARARLNEMEAHNADVAGNIGVHVSLLGGASRAYNYSQNPQFS